MGILIAAALGAAGAAEKSVVLKVGDRAPEFRLTSSDGKEYTLKQYRGKSAVVISWYPRTMSPG